MPAPSAPRSRHSAVTHPTRSHTSVIPMIRQDTQSGTGLQLLLDTLSEHVKLAEPEERSLEHKVFKGHCAPVTGLRRL